MVVVVVIGITVLCGWILHQHCQYLNMSVTLFIFKVGYLHVREIHKYRKNTHQLQHPSYVGLIVRTVISRQKVTEVEMLCKIPYLSNN